MATSTTLLFMILAGSITAAMVSSSRLPPQYQPDMLQPVQSTTPVIPELYLDQQVGIYISSVLEQTDVISESICKSWSINPDVPNIAEPTAGCIEDAELAGSSVVKGFITRERRDMEYYPSRQYHSISVDPNDHRSVLAARSHLLDLAEPPANDTTNQTVPTPTTLMLPTSFGCKDESDSNCTSFIVCASRVCLPTSDPCYESCELPLDGIAITGGVFCGLTLLSIICAVVSFVRQRRRGDGAAPVEHALQVLSAQTPSTPLTTDLKGHAGGCSDSEPAEATALSPSREDTAHSGGHHSMQSQPLDLPEYNELVTRTSAVSASRATTAQSEPGYHFKHYNRPFSASQKTQISSMTLPTSSAELAPFPAPMFHARSELDSRDGPRMPSFASSSAMITPTVFSQSSRVTSNSHSERHMSQSSLGLEDERMGTRAGPVPDWGV